MKTIILALALISTNAFATTFILVNQRVISPNSIACTYEANGVQITLLQSGFCPISINR